MIKVHIDQDQISALNGAMQRIEKRGKLFGNALILKTSDVFIKSAAVATPPGRSGYVGVGKKGIPVKSKQRKLVTISASAQKKNGGIYYYNTKTGKIIRRPIQKKFNQSQQWRVGLILITKFIEMVDTRSGKKFLKPVKPSDYGKLKKMRAIPTAGSGKLGWLIASNVLRRATRSSSRGVNKNVNTTIHKKGWNPYIFIKNNVDYITKISPMSARKGIRNATKIMETRYLKEEERFYTKEFRKNRIRNMMRYGVVT